ncbi:MAG TPA: helix-turn-helix transcriptional regulator [Tepidisphaeraceae bacterium]|nr:helix-turn-helix transcriptional regulator [Tepidisphaeraceae bacterium]
MVTQPTPFTPNEPRESAETVLAKNLIAARSLRGFTQHELAAAADVSRATVAQLEAGLSDPRLSTVSALAEALGIAPLALLASPTEVRALVDTLHHPSPAPAVDLTRVRFFLASGMLKDRLRAARDGAEIARQFGYESSGSQITAGLFAALEPDAVLLGAQLGKALADPDSA